MAKVREMMTDWTRFSHNVSDFECAVLYLDACCFKWALFKKLNEQT